MIHLGDSDPDEAQEPGNSDSPKENDNAKRLKIGILKHCFFSYLCQKQKTYVY